MIPTEPTRIDLLNTLESHQEQSWNQPLFEDGRNLVELVFYGPGQGNEPHNHHDFNEWWIVIKGQLVWEIGNYPRLHSKKGDIIYCPAGLRHCAQTIGDEYSLCVRVAKPQTNSTISTGHVEQLQNLPVDNTIPNLLVTNLDRLMGLQGQPPWKEVLISDDRNMANLICHDPGMTNNAHWHPGFDEWWAVLKGELTWKVGTNRPIINAKDGDLVFVPKGMRHFISTVGDESSLRLAVTTTENLHIYTDTDTKSPAPIE